MPSKIRAISEMPPPSDKEGVFRILGTVNYLAKFIEHKANLQEPISQLTQKDVAFVWEKPQEAFDKLKSVITSAPVLAYFDNSKETVLSVDASSTGLGAVIMQEGKPVAFRSKTLTPLEKMYANIERELLAIVWGAQKFHTYAYGRSVIVETDHKPLESIFRKPLNEAPPRLPRMLLNSLSMTLWCVMSPENSRSSQTALAEHLTVKLNRSVNPNMSSELILLRNLD